MCKVIHGNLIDGKGRCIHYYSEKDIVAIKFKCCNKFYACHLCHAENENHQTILWQSTETKKKVVACGTCLESISIGVYKEVTKCPYCHSNFNPNCSKHHHLYFE